MQQQQQQQQQRQQQRSSTSLPYCLSIQSRTLSLVGAGALGRRKVFVKIGAPPIFSKNLSIRPRLAELLPSWSSSDENLLPLGETQPKRLFVFDGCFLGSPQRHPRREYRKRRSRTRNPIPPVHGDRSAIRPVFGTRVARQTNQNNKNKNRPKSPDRFRDAAVQMPCQPRDTAAQ